MIFNANVSALSLFATVLLLTSCNANPDFFSKSWSSLVKNYENVRDLLRFSKPSAGNALNRTQRVEISKFHWEECTKDAPIRLTALAFNEPTNAFNLPGDFTLTAAADVATELAAPVKVEIKVYKKEVFWIKIPCDLLMGWCTIDDFCTKLPKTCPPPMVKNHIPCQCPAAKGTYAVNKELISVTDLSIKNLPSWLVDGEYRAEFRLHSGKGVELGCGKVYANVKIR